MNGMYLSNAMAMDSKANTTMMSVDDSKVSQNNVWTSQNIYDKYQKKTTAAVGSLLTVDANGELVAVAAGGGGGAALTPTEIRANAVWSSTNSNVWTQVPALTLTLSPGTYTVGFNVSMYLENNGQGMMYLVVKLFKDGSLVDGSERYVTNIWPSGYNGLWGGSASFEAPIITLTSNAVYTVQVVRMVRYGSPNLTQPYNVNGYVNAIKYA